MGGGEKKKKKKDEKEMNTKKRKIYGMNIMRGPGKMARI